MEGKSLSFLCGSFPSARSMAGQGERYGQGCGSKPLPAWVMGPLVHRKGCYGAQGFVRLWDENKTPCVMVAVEVIWLGFESTCSKPKGRLTPCPWGQDTPKTPAPILVAVTHLGRTPGLEVQQLEITKLLYMGISCKSEQEKSCF